jgi:hypothetical protein
MRIHPFLVAIALLSACGDDDAGGGGAAGAKKPAAKKAKDKSKKDKPKKLEVVTYVTTLEKVVPPAEAPTIRRRLKDRDFQPDVTGTENRNPFQSFTLPQVGTQTATEPTGPGPAARPTDLCARNKLKASGYAIKDLDLIGIVRRGSQYFAMVRDQKGVGHSIERGNCIGREKALVTGIGECVVTLERMPEPVAGGPEPTPVVESITFCQDDITADNLDAETPEPEPVDTSTSPPPTVAPENPTTQPQ